ncbi:hypothetical protein LOTGIDRAFT_130249, partial [Lottia gigantea]
YHPVPIPTSYIVISPTTNIYIIHCYITHCLIYNIRRDISHYQYPKHTLLYHLLPIST